MDSNRIPLQEQAGIRVHDKMAKTEGKDLETENMRIKQEAQVVLDSCLKAGNEQFINAINAQIMQHFEN